MFCSVPDFCKDAVNVYRTKKYIVKQDISVEGTDRTKSRDKQYEQIFADRTYINGKRLPSTSYTRRYEK